VVTMLAEAPAPTPEMGVALTADDGFRMGDIMLVTTFDGTFDLSRLNKADEFALGDVGCVPLAGEWGVNLRVAPPSLLADNFAAVMRLEVDGAFIPDKVLAPVEGVGIAAVEMAFFMPVLLAAGLGKVANFLLTVDAMASSAVMVESKSSDSEG